MTRFDYEYWPFGVAATDADVSQEDDKVMFLRAAHDDGYVSFRFGINDSRSRDRFGQTTLRKRRSDQLQDLAEHAGQMIAPTVF